MNSKNRWLYLGLIAFFWGCSSTNELTTSGELESSSTKLDQLGILFDHSSVFNGNFTGFALYDPVTEDFLFTRDADKYYTPASNTKLFTFYAGLKMLEDSVYGINYTYKGDSLFFWGTGDPSFLHEDLGNRKVFELLKSHEGPLIFSDANYEDKKLGSGWAWDDYNSSYSAEKTPMPAYGNLAKFTMERISTYRVHEIEGEYQVDPPYFRKKIEDIGIGEVSIVREQDGGNFEYSSYSDTTFVNWYRPYNYSPESFIEMISDTLKREVIYKDEPLPEDYDRVKTVTADSLYKHMLQPSDNFIAEQILLMASDYKFGSLNTRQVIEYMLKNHLDDLPDEPKWVDGSGLSRYNLFTPNSVVRLLEKIDQEFDSDEKLFELFPAGGQSGTIRNWYANRNDGSSYVYAKTGTLRNNHSLSGYLTTASGRKYLFSFMNSNYISSSSVVKTEMEKILWYIYENF